LKGTRWVPRESAMRRTAQYHNTFEGLALPSLPQNVKSVLQPVLTAVNGVWYWISKFWRWRTESVNRGSPDPRDNSASVCYVPLCNCRVRKLDHAKIVAEPHEGPDYDTDVFTELKKVYIRSRPRFLRTMLNAWIFDLREVRAVEVLSHSLNDKLMHFSFLSSKERKTLAFVLFV
jgi:hypothetical protein